MKTEARKEFIINVVYLSIMLVLAYLATKYVLVVLFPFLLGFVVAYALRPLIKQIHLRIKINNKIIAFIVLLVFYSLIGTALFYITIKVFAILKGLFEDIPQIYLQDIKPVLNQLSTWATDLFYRINPGIIDFVQQFDEKIIEQLGSVVRSFSTGAINLLTSMVLRLPNFLLSFLFAIIASFFITMDYEEIIDFFNFQFTDKQRHLFLAIHRNVIGVVFNFFKAYGILFVVTFVESAIGLSLLKINNAIGISLIIAFVDILPVLGTGTILIPWAAIKLFDGNLPIGIGLIVLYIIITVIRQTLGPRVVADSIGLYPLLTLVAMFLGVKYFGAIGLLGLPIVMTVVVKLHEEGLIHIWRDPNKDPT